MEIIMELVGLLKFLVIFGVISASFGIFLSLMVSLPLAFVTILYAVIKTIFLSLLNGSGSFIDFLKSMLIEIFSSLYSVFSWSNKSDNENNYDYNESSSFTQSEARAYEAAQRIKEIRRHLWFKKGKKSEQ